MPLEHQTVRFIDNFSAGTRGATSAEYFLEEGYAVIFMHRQFSLQPYSRHYSHSLNCFLEFMEADENGIHGREFAVVGNMHIRLRPIFCQLIGGQERRRLTAFSYHLLVMPPYLDKMRTVLHKYREVRSALSS